MSVWPFDLTIIYLGSYFIMHTNLYPLHASKTFASTKKETKTTLRKICRSYYMELIDFAAVMHFKRQQHDGCNRFSAVRLVTNVSKRKWISHWPKPSYKLQMAIKSESHAWITKKPTMIASESFQRFKIPILHSSDFTCLHKSC